jgi:hypothetical protein
MAGGALDLYYLGGMREILDISVAVRATENSMRTGCMLARIDGYALSGIGLHSRLAVACQAFLVFILILVCGRRGDGHG